MYPNPDAQRPGSGAGYVPYFYERGLHTLYPIHRMNGTGKGADLYQSPSPLGLESSISPGFNHIQSVEQVIARGYLAVAPGDAASAIIDDKAQTSWLGLDDVITQIRRRYTIYDRAMYSIDIGMCAARNAIYQHEAYCGKGSASSKQHYAKHKAIQELYVEKRMEQVNLWKDVSRLRTLLPENAQMYLTAHRKQSIMQELPGEIE